MYLALKRRQAEQVARTRIETILIGATSLDWIEVVLLLV